MEQQPTSFQNVIDLMSARREREALQQSQLRTQQSTSEAVGDLQTSVDKLNTTIDRFSQIIQTITPRNPRKGSRDDTNQSIQPATPIKTTGQVIKDYFADIRKKFTFEGMWDLSDGANQGLLGQIIRNKIAQRQADRGLLNPQETEQDQPNVLGPQEAPATAAVPPQLAEEIQNENAKLMSDQQQVLVKIEENTRTLPEILRVLQKTGSRPTGGREQPDDSPGGLFDLDDLRRRRTPGRTGPGRTSPTRPGPGGPRGPSGPGLGSRILGGLKGAATFLTSPVGAAATAAAVGGGTGLYALYKTIKGEDPSNWASNIVDKGVQAITGDKNATLGGKIYDEVQTIKGALGLDKPPMVEAGKGAFQKNLSEFKGKEQRQEVTTDPKVTERIKQITENKEVGLQGDSFQPVIDTNDPKVIKGALDNQLKLRQQYSDQILYEFSPARDEQDAKEKTKPVKILRRRNELWNQLSTSQAFINRLTKQLEQVTGKKQESQSVTIKTPEPAKSEFADVKFDATTVGGMELPEPPPPAEEKEVNAIPASEIIDPEAAMIEGARQEQDAKAVTPVVSQPGMAADGKGALPDPDAEMGIAPAKPVKPTSRMSRQSNLQRKTQQLTAKAKELGITGPVRGKFEGGVLTGITDQSGKVHEVPVSEEDSKKVQAARSMKAAMQKTAASEVNGEMGDVPPAPVKPTVTYDSGTLKGFIPDKDEVERRLQEKLLDYPEKMRNDVSVVNDLREEVTMEMKAEKLNSSTAEQQDNRVVPIQTSTSNVTPKIESLQTTGGMVDANATKDTAAPQRQVIVVTGRKSTSGTLKGFNADKDEVQRRVQEKLLEYPEKDRNDIDVLKDAREEAIMEMKAEKVNSYTPSTSEQQSTPAVPVAPVKPTENDLVSQYAAASEKHKTASQALKEFEKTNKSQASTRDTGWSDETYYKDPTLQAEYQKLKGTSFEASRSKRAAGAAYVKSVDNVVQTNVFGGNRPGRTTARYVSSGLANDVLKIKALAARGIDISKFETTSNTNYISVGDKRYSREILGAYDQVVQQELEDKAAKLKPQPVAESPNVGQNDQNVVPITVNGKQAGTMGPDGITAAPGQEANLAQSQQRSRAMMQRPAPTSGDAVYQKSQDAAYTAPPPSAPIVINAPTTNAMNSTTQSVTKPPARNQDSSFKDYNRMRYAF